ncbi:Rrf2 family transcriptional regulator [Paraflavitalea sp. CAU 1676]|uniref:RrF2 family transcriptional regulator n=1 Tax=Paraflavitalea sp. CAU 1676 TaxID=3032598 RepID=UPI0023DCCF32|nr:Rrf2 family transcriptional regulator [Paraflavitalea sp. CAU 1676]MDF2190653.1 Rrf2 family transcriptional regulator [Paraflavitalea sp. CAU 1676]
MNNSRFAISLHILTLLAEMGEELRSSEWIAGSININPVLVRKELSNLRNHGLIESKEGKSGGSALAKPANKILLSEIYEAVRTEYILGQAKNDPNPDCRIGRQINKHLDTLYEEVESDLIRKLGKKTLAEFSKQFK